MEYLKTFIDFIKIIPYKMIKIVLAKADTKKKICAYIINRIYVSDRIDDINFQNICDYIGVDNVYDAKSQFRMHLLSEELCNYICNKSINIPIDEKRRLYDFIQKEKESIDKMVGMCPYSVTERYIYRNKGSFITVIFFSLIIYILSSTYYNLNGWLMLLGALVLVLPGSCLIIIVTDMLFLKDDCECPKPAPIARLFEFLYKKNPIFKRFFDYYGK